MSGRRVAELAASGPCEHRYVKDSSSLHAGRAKRLTDREKSRIYPTLSHGAGELETLSTQTRTEPAATPLTNLWVLLVQNDGELATQDADGRVPMLARAGNDQKYLLVFKNVLKARQFLTTQAVGDAEPRMVVRANHDDIVRIARSAGVVGTLLDYDPATQKYASAGALA
jgi:hypothetical protein